jgi:hypothetical protein
VAPPAARRRTGWPVTRTPAARSSWAKYVAAVSGGSGTRPLPDAGFTGSLEYRFADTTPAARGHVRAKTGTLRGTSSLAGIATDLDGTSVAFVLMADRVRFLKTFAAEGALDAAAAALGACHCSVGTGR